MPQAADATTQNYGNASVPVRLVWCAEDWARPDERKHDRSQIQGAEIVTVEVPQHFSPLDQPDAVIEQIKTFARG
jgi:pimeloyl-ACP methyl ester carboxylesterase